MNELYMHERSRRLAEKIANNMPHALIIDGPSGIGVTTVARAIAERVGSTSFLLLPKRKEKGEFVVDPKEGSVIISDIRKLYEQTRTRQPDRQVYIIDTGEKSMTLGAQNAFLKLLEEPRQGVHFIIATHQFDQLLPTIVSRSQRLPLLPITDEQTRDLIESLHIEDETKKVRLGFVGSGRPALIKRLSGDEHAYDARVAIMRDAKTMISGSLSDKVALVHRYRESRADALTLLDDMNHQLKTVLKGQPDQRIVKDIEKHLETRGKIAVGGNIRLQLASDVL